MKSGKTLVKTLSWSLAIVLYIFATSFAASDHQPQRFRLASLSVGNPDTMLPQIRGLNDGLQEAGYVNGENILVDHLQDETVDYLRQRLQQLVQRRLDVIVAAGTLETAIAQRITNKVPIVFSPAIDPVRMGFVKSGSHPGTNLTGLTFSRSREDNAKQLALFKRVIPTIRRVTLFYDRREIYKLPPEIHNTIARTAQARGMQLTQLGVDSSTEAARLLDRMPSGASDGVFVICTALFREFKPVADAVARKRVPLFGCTTSQVADEGATMTYAPDLYLIGYRAASYVDRILRGIKPAQLPVETPSKMELVINLQKARSIGLKIPPEQLILADRVFQ